MIYKRHICKDDCWPRGWNSWMYNLFWSAFPLLQFDLVEIFLLKKGSKSEKHSSFPTIIFLNLQCVSLFLHHLYYFDVLTLFMQLWLTKNYMLLAVCCSKDFLLLSSANLPTLLYLCWVTLIVTFTVSPYFSPRDEITRLA